MRPEYALAALLLSLVTTPGCRTGSGYERASATSRRVSDFRENTVRLGEQIDLTTASLRTLAESPGVAPRSSTETFETFERELANLEHLARDFRKLYGRMDARAQEFFGHWIEDSAAIESAELRKRADERRAALQATYRRIGAEKLSVEQALSRLLDDLRDLDLFLEQDLTASGLVSARDLIEKAVQDGARVQGLLEETARAADETREALAPLEALVPPEKKRE